MGLIEDHIKTESDSKYPNRFLIKNLTELKELGYITFPRWKDTGRIIIRKSFLYNNRDAILHHDCTDIVRYAGNLFIQCLKSGVFYLDDETESKSLDVLEAILWDRNKNKFFDKNN